jgi:hypothetical protein
MVNPHSWGLSWMRSHIGKMLAICWGYLSSRNEKVKRRGERGNEGFFAELPFALLTAP